MVKPYDKDLASFAVWLLNYCCCPLDFITRFVQSIVQIWHIQFVELSFEERK